MSEYLCPSAPCEAGALLLGAMNKDGTVRFLTMRSRMDADDVVQAQVKAKPETYLRFANTCVTENCKQWQNGRCRVPDQASSHLNAKNLSVKPKKCSIREDCRWFFQEGLRACRICPLVLTEV